MSLLSFHNDSTVKEKYLSRVRAHAIADEIVKGKYWQEGKGCAVGCTIHSSNHCAYEDELGLPIWLASLEDRIFEGLPNGEAQKFPEQFLDAIPIGVDLTPVKWKFCAFLMRRNLELIATLKISDERKKKLLEITNQVLSIHQNAIETGAVDKPAAYADAASASASASAADAYAAAAARSNSYVKYRDELLKLLRESGN